MVFVVKGYGEGYDGEYSSREAYDAHVWRMKKQKRKESKARPTMGYTLPQSARNPYSEMNEEGDVTIPESSISGCWPGCNTTTKSGSFTHGSNGRGGCCTGQ